MNVRRLNIITVNCVHNGDNSNIVYLAIVQDCTTSKTLLCQFELNSHMNALLVLRLRIAGLSHHVFCQLLGSQLLGRCCVLLWHQVS